MTLLTALATVNDQSQAEELNLTGVPAIYALPAELAPGGTLHLSGHDFPPGLDLNIALLDGSRNQTPLGVWQTDGSGLLRLTTVLPLVPPGSYNVTAGDGGTMASTPLIIRSRLGFNYAPASGSPGVLVPFTVSNLVTGTLRLDYDGAPVFGPVPVTGGSYSSSFVVPNDRPLVWNTAVALSAVNLVGGHTIGKTSGTFQAQAPLPAPIYEFTDVVLPGNDLSPGEVFTITGRITLPRGKFGPDDVLLSPQLVNQMRINVLWQAGGLTFPVSNGQSQINGNGTFKVQGVIPSLFNGDAISAGSDTSSKVGLVLQTDDTAPLTFITPYGIGDPPPFQVKVVDENGTPIPNAIVKTFSAAHESISGQTPSGTNYSFNANDLYQQNVQVSSTLSNLLGGGDPFNCKNTAVYGRTDANGIFTAQFGPELLAMAGKKISLGFINGGKEAFMQVPITITFDLVVNATYQGFGTVMNGKAQPYTRPIQFLATTKRFYDGKTGKLLNTVPLVVVLPKLPQGTKMEMPVQAAIPGMPIIKSFDNYVGTGIPLVAFGNFVSFADKNAFPDNVFSFLAPVEVQFKHNALEYGSLISATLTLDKQTYPFTAQGNAIDNQCLGTIQYSVTIPNSHRLAKGFHQGLVQVKDGTGFITKRYVGLVVVDPPEWIQDSKLQNRRVEIFLSENSGYQVRLTADNLPKNAPGSQSTLGANVPKIGQLDNAAGANSKLQQTIKAAGAESLIHTGAFQSKALNTQAADVDFGANQTKSSVLNQTTMLNPDSASSSFDIPKKTIPILDTGKVPLFRYVWGVWPIASATIGADMWFKADLTFEGKVTIDPVKGSISSSLLTNPEANVGVDAFFDLSILFGFVSADAHAIPQITVSMPVLFVNGTKSDNDICFRYRLDIKWSAKVGVCIDTPFGSTCIKESGTKNVFDGYTPKTPLCTPSQSAMSTAVQTTPPPAANPSIASDGFGHTLTVWRTESGDIVSSLYNGLTQLPAVQITGNNASVDPQVAFFAPNQAVAVWAQSSLTPQQAPTTNLTDTLKAQHLAYSLWNGSTWSPPQNLTTPTTGEGNVVLAGCISSDPVCPAGGQVTAVWVKDVAGALGQHRLRLFHSAYTNGAWSAAAAVDAGSTAMDAQPTVTYWNGASVVGWVRDMDRVLGTVSDRWFAYRVLRSAQVSVPGDLPPGMAEPSLAVGGGKLKLAFTVAEDPLALIGNQRTLYTAVQTCGRTCSWSYQAMQDSHGRDIHAEGPMLTIGGLGQGIVTYRALGFGAVPGGGVVHFPEDSLGTVMGTGDMAQLQVDFLTSTHNPTYLTNDGKVNWQVTAAFDPMLNIVQTVAAQGAAPVLPLGMALPEQLASSANQQRMLVGGSEQSLVFVTQAQQPDFAVTAVASSTPYPQASQTFVVTVTLQNYGPDWTGSSDLLDITATWDGAPGYGVPAGLAQIDELFAGMPLTLTIPVAAPANVEVPHTLFVTVNPAAAIEETTRSNNQGTLSLEGLETPGTVIPTLETGSSLVTLSWEKAADPRVAGYRIYRQENGGQPVPVGSSPTNGFADLTAAFGQNSSYAVASYSNNGVESSLGPWLVVSTVDYRVHLPMITR